MPTICELFKFIIVSLGGEVNPAKCGGRLNNINRWHLDPPPLIFLIGKYIKFNIF